MGGERVGQAKIKNVEEELKADLILRYKIDSNMLVKKQRVIFSGMRFCNMQNLLLHT